VPPVVLEHAEPNPGIRGVLVAPPDRGLDPDPAHIGRLAVLLENSRTRHFGQIIRPQ
jgi:hypothetical protein